MNTEVGFRAICERQESEEDVITEETKSRARKVLSIFLQAVHPVLEAVAPLPDDAARVHRAADGVYDLPQRPLQHPPHVLLPVLRVALRAPRSLLLLQHWLLGTVGAKFFFDA